jgi:hypothetical protein
MLYNTDIVTNHWCPLITNLCQQQRLHSVDYKQKDDHKPFVHIYFPLNATYFLVTLLSHMFRPTSDVVDNIVTNMTIARQR